MYVFVDMEWISNQHGNHWPTQLAAARVDAQWNTVDTFSVLFRPRDFSLQQWGHMAFSGWSREQFLNGESLYAGLDAFRHWLQPEDTICWWHQEASDLFNMFSKVSGVPDMTQHVVLLCDYIYGYLAGQEASVGSPYKICAARNIVTPSPAHCSVNDVATMQLLAQDIGFEQKYLLEPPKDGAKTQWHRKVLLPISCSMIPRPSFFINPTVSYYLIIGISRHSSHSSSQFDVSTNLVAAVGMNS